MADSEDDEQLTKFYEESKDKILAWALEKRHKGSSLSKEER